jgi:hypothetical protein
MWVGIFSGPTTSIYNATNSTARFYNKNYFLSRKNAGVVAVYSKVVRFGSRDRCYDHIFSVIFDNFRRKNWRFSEKPIL